MKSVNMLLLTGGLLVGGLWLGWAGSGPPAVAQRGRALLAAWRVVPLGNGPNEVDLDGDGAADLVFMARRENYNAHSHNIFLFFVFAGGTWHAVPFPGLDGHPEKYALGTVSGADCDLRDIRVLRPPESVPDSAALVVVGQRKTGASYGDSAPVAFTLYRLRVGRAAEPGEPPFFFEMADFLPATRPYCDIQTAFATELGLGSYETPR
ncbi:MAG: hypothetical protein K9N49_00575 [Candidatus Marinimicrobia bacterium]|nr:hypothetical protein [Candidatus Neomarinimicrobiota bacterium]